MRGGKAHPLYRRVVTGAEVPMAIVISAGASASSSSSGSGCGGGGGSSAGDVAAQLVTRAVELRPGDISWNEFLKSPAAAGGRGGGGGGSIRPVPHVVDASAYSNILFSSGTTVRRAHHPLALNFAADQLCAYNSCSSSSCSCYWFIRLSACCSLLPVCHGPL
jgi:hypothetical protein